MIFTDLNSIEEPRRRFGEAGPGTEPRAEEATGTTAGNRRRQTMTTNWKRTEAANGAGAHALSVFARVCAAPGRRHAVRSLRWKQDAVCRDASADADLREGEPGELSGIPADSTGSSLTRTFFFTSRIQSQPQTRKETHNTTQKKKGKTTNKTVTISQETRNLSLTTKEKKLWQESTKSKASKITSTST